jgi:DNA-binding HxlR family transcriptional regulator
MVCILSTLIVSRLRQLLHHRWSLPVLVELDRTGGARFGALRRSLDLAPDSLRRTLDALIEDGLVARGPESGRTHYSLTARGARLAGAAAPLLEELRRLDATPVGLRKWSLPTLLAADGGRRFSEIRAALAPATSRALALALKDLLAAGLLARGVHEGFPPRPWYAPSDRAAGVVRRAEALRAAAER